MRTTLSLPLSLCLFLILSACAPNVGTSNSDTLTQAPAIPTAPDQQNFSNPLSESEIEAVSTNQTRLLPIRADLSAATFFDIPLPGKPVWVAGIPFDTGFTWAVVLENGSVLAFLTDNDGYAQIAITPKQHSPDTPLRIYSRNGQLFAFAIPKTDASPFSQPAWIDPGLSRAAYISTDGDLVITQNEQQARLPVNALQDSVILMDESHRLLLLTHPTERYGHGVLGDGIEAAGVTLVETSPEPGIIRTIRIPSPDVIEGLYPVWADINDDGELEILLTLSNAQSGSRIVAYREDGELLAEGPSIGAGFRWRHQLVVAPFGVSGENLLAVIRTPHIGGVLEFYRLEGDRLEIVAEMPGFSTHSIGSRNLFTAQAGDFDNDGQIELLAPDQSHTRLGIIGIMDEAGKWLALEAELVTNLAAASRPYSEEVSLAAGLSNNTLRIWLP